MANSFRKRRRQAGPSKNELKVLRGRPERQNTLRSRFPEVARVSLALRFTGERGQVFDEVRRVVQPDEGLDLSAACPGRCGVGNFSFDALVTEAVASRKNLIESSAVCAEPLAPGLPQTCGCTLDCRVDLEFNPEPAPPPQTPPAPAAGNPA